MKRILLSGITAVTAFALLSPVAVMAAPADDAAAKAQAKQQAIQKCEQRIKLIQDAPALFEKYRTLYFAEPRKENGTYPDYPSVANAVTLGTLADPQSKKETVQSSKSVNSANETYKPFKKAVNFYLVSERLRGSQYMAENIHYKTGDKARVANQQSLTKLANSTKTMDEKINFWNKQIASYVSEYKDGNVYEKNYNYGASDLSAKEKDMKLVTSEKYITKVSHDTKSCETAAGRNSAAFLSKRRAILIRAIHKGITETKTTSEAGSKAYKEIRADFKKARQDKKAMQLTVL